MGRHRTEVPEGTENARRMAVVIAVAGLLAVAAVFGLWSLFAGAPTAARASSTSLAARTAEPEATPTFAVPVPTETFVVPTPTYATPSLTLELGTKEPEIPDVIIDPSTITPPPRVTAPAPGPVVTAVALDCARQGRRVRATLSFTSTAPVALSLTAGSRTESTTAGGNVHVSLTGDATSGAPVTCSAVVNGQPVGPVTGH